MIRRRRLKVQCFLIILCVCVSGTIIYKNLESVKEFNQKVSIGYNNLPRKVLLSVKNIPNVSTSTEVYLRKLSTTLKKKYVTKSMAQLGKMDEINKHFLFLNSVPKSGSEILIFLLEKIQGTNNFKHIRLKGEHMGKLSKLQQTLADSKSKVKQKAAKINTFINQTGGGPQLDTTLTAREERLLSLMGMKSVKGDSTLEFGLAPKKVNGENIEVQELSEVSSPSNFQLMDHDYSENTRENIYTLEEILVNEMYDTRRSMAVPLSFDRTVYFVNFTTFDKQSPTYINLIRDPIAKVMARAILPKTGQYDNYFIRCLTDNRRNCNFKDGRPYDLTIPYFCGHDPRCMLLNNEWALETAKKNVAQFYQVVGVLEELNITLGVLEQKVPQFFNGAKIAYQQNLLDIYKHKKEPKIPENVRQKLEHTLTKELEFYRWVKDRLLKGEKLKGNN